MNLPLDVFLLTERRYLSPTRVTDYIGNVLREDGLVLEAMQRLGLRVQRVDWADPSVNWKEGRAALFRTTWDYFDRFPEFSRWLNQVSAQTTLINPADTIRWNMDKHYLGDLRERGINIPDTTFLEQGEWRTLQELQNETGWEEMILKPCVSGAAKNTFRLHEGNLQEYEARFRTLVQEEAFMIQPLQQFVLEEGELSLMVIGGEFTHAVRKVAKAGDFRVQDDWGGTVHEYSPSQEERMFAEQAVRAVDPMPLYARVDLIRDNAGDLAIMELELIEPEMWFRNSPSAAGLLGEVIAKSLAEQG